MWFLILIFCECPSSKFYLVIKRQYGRAVNNLCNLGFFVPSHQCKTEAALLKSVETNACNGSVREEWDCNSWANYEYSKPFSECFLCHISGIDYFLEHHFFKIMKGCERLTLLLVKFMYNAWLRGKLLRRGRSSLVTAENFVIHTYMEVNTALLATLTLLVWYWMLAVRNGCSQNIPPCLPWHFIMLDCFVYDLLS